MDEGTDDDDDDEYDETNPDDLDCESTFYYGPRGQLSSGRLCRRNVSARSTHGGYSGNDNSTFRIRSKWKKYHYQAVPRAMTIQEEDEEIAGPSTAPTATTSTTQSALHATPISSAHLGMEYLLHNSNRTIQIPNICVTMANERNRHVIIHVNDVERHELDDVNDDDDDDNDDNDETDDDVEPKSIPKNNALLVAYESDSVSSV